MRALTLLILAGLPVVLASSAPAHADCDLRFAPPEQRAAARPPQRQAPASLRASFHAEGMPDEDEETFPAEADRRFPRNAASAERESIEALPGGV